MIRAFIAILLGLAPLCANAAENADEATGNMIRNPGFEKAGGLGPWAARNWWSKSVKAPDGSTKTVTNRFDISATPDDPHSGSKCLKISMSKMLGGDLQFLQAVPELKPGMALRLSFWLRGQANSTTPFEVAFRQDSMPWRKYFSARLSADGKWREHVFNVSLPPKTEEDTALIFSLRGEGVFWLDDVKLIELPPVEAGPIPQGNRLRNGSFEVGRDGWFAGFRESAPSTTLIAEEANKDANIEAVGIADAPDGKRALRFEVRPGCRMELTSAFLPLKYGREATVEFSMKSEGGKRAKINASLLCGEFPNVIREGKSFQTKTKGWERFSFKTVPAASNSGSYALCFNASDPGVYLLDEIRVWQGDAGKSAKKDAPELGWEAVDATHPANFFKKGEAPVFKILARGEAGLKKIELTGSVVDAWERKQGGLALTIPLDEKGFGETLLKLPEQKRYGGFKASLALPEAKAPAVEIVYCVPVEVPAPSEAKDAFFGAHVRLSPYNLLLAEKAGFRLLRMHPPNNTKWCFIETEKGKLDFHTEGAARAKAQGFKIMGNLGTVPEFYADKPANEVQNWYHAYPPEGEEGWLAYERYAKETVKAFAPYISIWEIGNESDGQFLQVPKGGNREDIYMEYARRTLKALDGAKGLTLIGGAITGAERPFLGKCLEGGLGKYVDALSFHHYNAISQGTISRREKDMEFWRTFKNREGQAMELYHTEGYAGFGWDDPTWLESSGHPFVESPLFHEQWRTSGLNVQSAVAFKALGAKCHIVYAAYAQASGQIDYRNECSVMVDLNGLPLPCAAAHAAAVHFLDDAKPSGLEWKDGAPYAKASFVKDGKHIDVLWSEKEGDATADAKARAFAKGRAAFDMMGNQIDETEITLSAAPIYLMEK